MSNPSLILPQSPAYGEDYVYAAQVNDGVVPLYNVLPLTFTRASNGTRINKDGILENMPYNLLENTDTFSSWNLEGGTLTSGFTAPDGSSTAYKYVQIPGGGLYSGFSAVTSDVKCAQVWIKSVSGGSLTVNLSDGASYFGQFNVTGEWQLFTGQYTGNTRIGLYLYAISNAQGIYVWHPQLNIGSTAKPYLATTDRLNMPRITYPVGGGCGALLLEKQSTNLVSYSQDFGNAYWSKGGATITANATTSPDGTQDADKIVENTTSTTTHYINKGLTLSATTYTSSVFAKASERKWIFLIATTSADVGAFFDLENGVVGSVSSGYTASIENFGNGWYRCSISFTATAATWYINYLIATANNTYNYAGTSGSGIYVWGAQLEASSYATSYIPTTSTSATRIQDVCYKTGISNLIGQTEGVLFCQFNKPVDTLQNLRLNVSDGGVNNWVFVGFESTSLRAYLRANNTVIETQTFSTTANINKMAIAYKSGNYAIYHNGIQISSGTTTYSFSATLSQLNFGENPTDYNIYPIAQIAQFELFTTRLTNAELATLTTI